MSAPKPIINLSGAAENEVTPPAFTAADCNAAMPNRPRALVRGTERRRRWSEEQKRAIVAEVPATDVAFHES
jgi:hypothetical protein